MKAIGCFVLGASLLTAPLMAVAQLKPVDDQELGSITGQSGLLIEIGIGNADYSDLLNVDWSGAGITVEAHKWIVDMETYNSDTNEHLEASSGKMGGVITQGIKVAGSVDITVDGVKDTISGSSGIGIAFDNSLIHRRIDSTAVFLEDGTIGASMGASEVLGLSVDGLHVTLSGR